MFTLYPLYEGGGQVKREGEKRGREGGEEGEGEEGAGGGRGEEEREGGRKREFLRARRSRREEGDEVAGGGRAYPPVHPLLYGSSKSRTPTLFKP